MSSDSSAAAIPDSVARIGASPLSENLHTSH
jgi:hypothetical protein